MRARDEHLAWCKERAFEYLVRGELADALASMMSDLAKHPETRCSSTLAWLGISYVTNRDHAGLVRWIEGFR